MKKFMGAAAIALLLAGCNDEKPIEAGDYLFESAQIEFDNREAGNNEEGRKAYQQEMVRALNESGKAVYYSITPMEVTAYGYGKHSPGRVEAGRVKLDELWHTLKPGADNTLRLITDKDSECAFYTCQITITLKKAEPDSSELRHRKQQYADDLKARQSQITAARDEFMRTPMPDEPGTLFSPVESFTFKLPWRFQNEVSQRAVAWEFKRQIDRLTIENVNPKLFAAHHETFEAYSARKAGKDFDASEEVGARIPENAGPLAWALQDRVDALSIHFIVADGKKEDIDLTRWLATQNEVVYRSQNGAVYYNNRDELEVIYLQYDEATQRYFIGLGDAKSIPSAVKTFAILRTVDARFRGKDVVTLDELTLPLAQKEVRYQATPGGLFYPEVIHEKIKESLEEQLEKPYRFISRQEWVHPARIEFQSHSRSREIAMVLDTRAIPALMAEAQKQHPEGKAAGDLFIYGDRYNLYRDTGNGLTLVFTVPDDVGNRVERIMLLPVLRQFDMTTLTAVPAVERKNLLKYNVERYVRGKSSDRFFVVNEGIIDNQGNLIVPMAEDSDLEFEDHDPWLLVQKRKNQGEDKGRKSPEGFIYDAQGKLQLYTAKFGELINNRLVVGGDAKKQGLYDLEARRWLAAPAWDELVWKDGLFIASDYEYSESGFRGGYLRQALLDTGGNILATGRYIDILRKTDRVTVSDGKGNVSLIDRQGRVLFTHPGHQLNWIPQIDAYSVLISPPGSRQRSLGIFSERGETILPMKYGHVQVAGDRLKVWMPDMETVVWFDLEQVKNWRNHQPLKEVPAPE